MTEIDTRPADIDISVVMACHTEERLSYIEAALASLGRQTLRPRAVIVAVDNNEALAELLRAKFDWITVVVNNSHRGASSTRNCGVEGVTTEYTAIFDDDEIADPEWLYELTRPLADPGVVGTGGRYQAVWESGEPSWFPEEFGWVVGHSYRGLPTVTAPVRNVWSGNMAMRTEDYRKVGGFRTDFGKGATFKHATVEDTDICIRMAIENGGRWMYVPSAVVDHVVPPSRSSLSYFVSRCFAEGRGKALMKQNLGAASAIDTERDYAWKTIGTALGRFGVPSRAALAQCLAIALGLTGAVSGYLLERAGGRGGGTPRVQNAGFFGNAIRAFVEANVTLSRATEQRWGLPGENLIWESFRSKAAELIRALPDGAVVLDLGGGASCSYADAVEPPGRIRLIAVDISAEELAQNTDVAETRVADVAKQLPMPDASVDLILSQALLEHVDGVPAAIRHMARVLKPGGASLHLVPGRNSLFGIAARLLPFGPLLRMTLRFAPWFQDYNFGFQVYYDHCYPQALEREFQAAGFSDVRMQISWSCEDFFVGVYPLYLLHALYEQLVRRLRLRRMAAYTVVHAVR